jgi:hypothetical protein
MNTDSYHIDEDPAPHAHHVTPLATLFGLFGGPSAWFVQLCGGYALATEPCFLGGVWLVEPAGRLEWTWPAMIALMVAAVTAAVVAFMFSWGAYMRTQHEVLGDERHLTETEAGRTRFLALWGMVLGMGFALATAITAVAFITLPRCAG